MANQTQQQRMAKPFSAAAHPPPSVENASYNDKAKKRDLEKRLNGRD
jgi:hypothetical protein